MYRTIDARYTVVRNSADFCRLYAVDGEEPTLRMDDSGEIKMSLSGSFIYDSRVNLLSDRIRAEIIIDGTVYPLGVYLPATGTIIEDETRKKWQIEAYDQCWLVRDTKTEDLLHFDSGTPYLDAIEQLLTRSGVILTAKTASTAKLTEDREDWDIGTSYLKIVNQLLSEINYGELWFDANGIAQLHPARTPTIENVKHVLTEGDVKSLLLPGITRESDIYNTPNVFVCVCDNPDKKSVMIATSENTSVSSPLSTVRRGRRIVSFQKVDNIASQSALQTYADRLRDNSMLTGETAIVTTAIFPDYGAADVTALSYGDFDAVCIEHSWEMELKAGGNMTHTLERIVTNYG